MLVSDWLNGWNYYRGDVVKDESLLFPEWESKQDELSWQAHWDGMPEYNNQKEAEPAITALFKFKSQEDFEVFNTLLKQHVYKTNKVFDGMQGKTEKRAWFPLREKGSEYKYISGNNNES
jgi:hypothetical protein